MLAEGVRMLESLPKICELFAGTVVWLEVHNSKAVWNKCLEAMQMHHKDTSPATIYAAIGDVLTNYSATLTQVGIQPPDPTCYVSAQTRAENEFRAEVPTPTDQEDARNLYDD